MFGFNPWIILIIAVAFTAYSGSLVYKGYSWGAGVEERKCIAAVNAANAENIDIERMQSETRGIIFSDDDFVERLRSAQFGEP